MSKKHFFLRRSIHSHAANQGEESHGLKRHFGALHLMAIGVGAIIGAGIFVITGTAAAENSGPAISLSFIIAALVCLFTGLCYAELSSIIPSSGGSYAYAYVSMGEFPAWIVGWTITAQYLIAVSVVAVGWSGYFVSLMKDFGVFFSDTWTQAPLLYSEQMGWHFGDAFLNTPAVALIALFGVLICIGVRAAAHFNNAMVAIKLSALILFLLIGVFYIDPANWHPFIPENTGVFGQYGWSGVLRAASIVFFAFIGFDAVATLAQETIDPQTNLPKGILGSLGICTVAYILTGLVLTGVVSYTMLNVPDPMAVALQVMNSFFWLKFVIKLAILAGLASVVLVMLLAQTRVFYAISNDGLLPSGFSKVHPRFRTPFFASIVAALIALTFAGLFPVDVLGRLVAMMALFLFAIVCLGVLILRKSHPEYPRPFKVPLVPWVPALGILACFFQMCMLPIVTWVQLLTWLFLGLVIYFIYSVRHSKLRKEHEKRS